MSFEARATTLEVPLLKRLAQSEGKVLTFYDLETTTFLGVPHRALRKWRPSMCIRTER